MEEPTCAGCRALLRRIAEREARMRDLEARLGPNASNSSLPPSANPPPAPPPVRKQPTGRTPGGQPGHDAHLRQRWPAQRLTEPTVHLVPDMGEACHDDLPCAPAADDPAPRWHQVVELPEIPVPVTAYQAHGRTCPNGGHVTGAAIPDAIRAHVGGPRLTATMSLLSGALHTSKRGIAEFVETVLGVPIALGTVSNREPERGAALAPAHAEAQPAVQPAAAQNVAETGWKRAGATCWLGGAATAWVACFRIAPTRGAAGWAAWLGRKIQGIIRSDRWSVDGQLPLGVRQWCGAHRKRDFQQLVEGGGPGKE